MIGRFLAAIFALLLLAQPAAAQLLTTGVGTGAFGGSSPPGTLISSVNVTFPATTTDSGCWSGQWASGTPVVANPDGGTPTTIPVVDTGYDTSGNATTYSHNRIITARVRQTYPNDSLLTAATVSFDDYVYPTTAISGVDTSGCDIARQPVANWATPHRQVVNGTTPVMEVLAFSHDAQAGSEVAAVICNATDGTLTVTGSAVSAMTISGRADINPVIVYSIPAINISTLANGLITYNCKVYPWYGSTASINDSSLLAATNANLRLFSPRYFWKTATAPINVFICQQLVVLSCPAAGVDATCVASTTFATANAAPCLTFEGALNKLKAAGAIDNAIVYVSSNTGTPPTLHTPTTGAMTQNGGCLVVTRDPQVTEANAQIGFGNTGGVGITLVTNPTGTGCIRFTDITTKRVGNSTITGNNTNPLEVIFDQVILDNGSSANGNTWFNTGAEVDDYIFDATVLNPAANFLAPTTKGNHRIVRGVNIPATVGVEATTLIGSSFTGTGPATPTGLTNDGLILAFNKFMSITASSIATIATEVPTGAARVQNIFEEISSATGNTLFNVSNDNASNNVTNMIDHYNLVVGAFDAGRSNTDYDEGTTERTNKFHSCRGNLYGQINTKGDVYVSTHPAGPAASTRTGNWGFLYAVGCAGQWSQYQDANGGGLGTSFAQAYGGIGSSIGPSSVTAQMPTSKFTDYEGVTCVNPGVDCSSNVAGVAPPGTYTLTTGAAVKGIVPKAMLPFDLAGVARPTTADTAGPYVAP